MITGVVLVSCVCACMGGRTPEPLCDSALDLQPFCMGICPIEPPSLEPLQLPSLPPLGTTECHQEHVALPDPATGWTDYQWREVCS